MKAIAVVFLVVLAVTNAVAGLFCGLGVLVAGAFSLLGKSVAWESCSLAVLAMCGVCTAVVAVSLKRSKKL